MKKIKFKRKNLDAKISFPHYEGDVGYDVFSIEEKWVFPFFPQTIDIGIALEMPPNTYCTIETRSKHGVKNNLRAHRGIIDNGYRKEISVKIYNHGLLPYKIKKGEKIAQLIFHNSIIYPLEEVKELSKTQRGEKGFGSTG